MKKPRLFLVVLFFAVATFGLCSTSCVAADEPSIELELTFPAGKSPQVFTQGWVFGARCIVNSGTPDEQDVSSQVKWSGTGIFMPPQGAISRPVFNAAGKNTITLSVELDGKTIRKSFSVDAVNPVKEGGAPLYMALGDLSQCPLDAHGCKACPHSTVGPIIMGSPNVNVRGLPAARVGDKGVAVPCCASNMFEIIEGDPNVLIDGKPAARAGDQTKHCGGMGRLTGVVSDSVAYHVLFQLTIPVVKEEKKPRKKEGESDEEWTRRRMAAYRALTYSDFNFEEKSLSESPIVVMIRGDAKITYPINEFTYDSKWTMKVSIQGSSPGQGAVGLDGMLLLTVKGVYTSPDELRGHNPELKEKESIKAINFASSSGVASLQDPGSSGVLGPLKKGWSQQDKYDAVELSKKFYMFYDCFIAHAVYAGQDVEKIELFRNFRDKVLLKSAVGEHLVRLYYEYGPMYALRLKQNPRFFPAARFCLDAAVLGLRRLDMENEGAAIETYPFVWLVSRAVSYFFEEGRGGISGLYGRALNPLPREFEKN